MRASDFPPIHPSGLLIIGCTNYQWAQKRWWLVLVMLLTMRGSFFACQDLRQCDCDMRMHELYKVTTSWIGNVRIHPAPSLSLSPTMLILHSYRHFLHMT